MLLLTLFSALILIHVALMAQGLNDYWLWGVNGMGERQPPLPLLLPWGIDSTPHAADPVPCRAAQEPSSQPSSSYSWLRSPVGKRLSPSMRLCQSRPQRRASHRSLLPADQQTLCRFARPPGAPHPNSPEASIIACLTSPPPPGIPSSLPCAYPLVQQSQESPPSVSV